MSQNLVKGRNGRRRRWSNWGGECDKGGGNTILGGQGATDGERECAAAMAGTMVVLVECDGASTQALETLTPPKS